MLLSFQVGVDTTAGGGHIVASTVGPIAAPSLVAFLHSPIGMSELGAVVYFGVLLIAAYQISATAADRWLNVTIIACAGSIGWLLGELLSPYDSKEGQRFASYAGAVAVFASGYLAGKADGLVKYVLSPDRLGGITVPRAFRGLAFVTAALVTMLVTYATREYPSKNSPIGTPATASAEATPKVITSDTVARHDSANRPFPAAATHRQTSSQKS